MLSVKASVRIDRIKDIGNYKIQTEDINKEKRQERMPVEELRKEPVTIGLIVINILVFLAVEFTGSSENAMHMLDWGAAYTPMIIQGGEYYRLFTCMFLHFGIEHLANNMLVLFVLGSRLEQCVGKIRLLLIYLVGGVLGNVFSLCMEMKAQDFAVSAGASGAVFAIMGAMIYVVIRNRGWLGDLSLRQILVMAAFSLYFGFTSTGVDNTAHVGGLIAGLVLAVLIYHPGRRYER